MVVTPYLFTEAWPLYLLAASFVVTNGLAAWRGWLRGMHPVDRRSWGTVAFPLALLIVLPLTWHADRQFILQSAFLILAVADPLAAAVGERSLPFAGARGDMHKSAAGSATFLVVAGCLGAAALVNFPPSGIQPPLHETLWLALLLAGTTTAVESLGGRGWDNLFIVVATVVLLLVWQEHQPALAMLTWAALGGIAFALAAWRFHFLTLSGAVAGGLFGATLVGLGGWEWIAPALVFFVLSSLLSRLAPRLERGEVRSLPRRSRRDAAQVYANGGVAWALMVTHALVPHPFLYWGFVASLAAATADTWATELGPLFRQQPRMILSGRPVPRGTSGAVTAGGTMVGLLGAVIVWGSAWLTSVEPTGGPASWVTLLAVSIGGLAGSAMDSVAGAAVQAVYLDPQTGRLVDEGVDNAFRDLRPVRGWRFIGNNLVNLICTATGALVALAILAAGGW